jgi:hypothetical protein
MNQLLISHRGNISGKNPTKENSLVYILNALEQGYDVEIDVWNINENELYLGHDEPQYKVTLDWLKLYSSDLWVHCKNINALLFFKDVPWRYNFNYFWHENDTVTLTSKGYIWAYPGKQPISKSIAVLPETYNENVQGCFGVCSDYIEKYKT